MASVHLVGLVSGHVSVEGCDTVRQLCRMIQGLRGVILHHDNGIGVSERNMLQVC
jgi:hypothetical protein